MEFGSLNKRIIAASLATVAVFAPYNFANSAPATSVAFAEGLPNITPTPIPTDLAPVAPVPTPIESGPPTETSAPFPIVAPTPTLAPAPVSPLENGVVFGTTPVHGPTEQYTQNLKVDGMDVDVIVPGDKIIRAEVGMLHQFHLSKRYAEKDTAKFIRLGGASSYLFAYPSSPDGSWNAGLCCGEASRTGRDDAKVLVHLTKYLRYKYNLGPEVPTIQAGISNGAMETAEIYCKYPKLLDAAILASGNLQDPSCGNSARVPNLWMLRSLIDKTVPTGEPVYKAPLRLVYSGFLGRFIESDPFTVNAFMNGKLCKNQVTKSRGITHQTITCNDNSAMDYVVESRGPHGWRDIAGPGTIDTSDRAANFVETVINKKIADKISAARFRSLAAAQLAK